MIKVQFEAANISLLKTEMITFLNSLNENTKTTSISEDEIISINEERVNELLEETKELIKEEPKKRGRKAKAKEEQESLPIVEAEIASEVSELKSYTKEDVHEALQRVNVEVGLAKARDILHKFGINRVSEIRNEQFAPFIQACESAIGV